MNVPKRVNVFGVKSRIQIVPNIWCEPLKNQDGKVSGMMIENWNIDEQIPRTVVPLHHQDQTITVSKNVRIKMFTDNDGMYCALIVQEM